MSAPESAEAVLEARLAALQTLADAAMGAAETEPNNATKQRMVARQSIKGEASMFAMERVCLLEKRVGIRCTRNREPEREGGEKEKEKRSGRRR